MSAVLQLKSFALHRRNTFPTSPWELQAPFHSSRFGINVTFLERPSLITLFKWCLPKQAPAPHIIYHKSFFLHSMAHNFLRISYISLYLLVCFLFTQVETVSVLLTVAAAPQQRVHRHSVNICGTNKWLWSHWNNKGLYLWQSKDHQ